MNNLVKKSGIILEALPNYQFKVQTDDGKESRCYMCGKMRMNKISVLPGDKVDVEIPSNFEKIGRIMYRK